MADRRKILVYGIALLVCSYHVYIFALGGKNHKCNTENSVGTSCEDFKLHITEAVDFKTHFCTLGTSYPIPLGFFDGIAPIYFFKPVKQSLGVCRNS